MPETIEPPVDQQPIAESPSYKPEHIAERFRQMMAPETQKPTEEPEKPVEAPPVEKKAETPELPEEVFTGKHEDPDKALLEEAPKGPLKHENWAKLQAKAKEWQSKAQELEEKLKNPIVPDDFKNDLEATKARLAEREAELERIAVERSPKFKELFTDKETHLRETYKSISKDLGIEEDQAEAIFNSKGKKRYELIDDLDVPQSAKADLTTMLRQKDELGTQRDNFLSKSREELHAWEESHKAENDARLAKLHEHETRIFESKLSELTKANPLLQKIEGNEKWNTVVEQNIAEAKRFFSGNITAEEAADYAIAGATAKQAFRMFEVARERLQAANEELSRLKAAAPTVEGSAGKTTVDDSKLSIEERAKKTFMEMAAPKNKGW